MVAPWYGKEGNAGFRPLHYIFSYCRQLHARTFSCNENQVSYTCLVVIWNCLGMCIVACVLTAIDLRKYRVFSMICYLAMGWVIIFFVKQTYEVMSLGGIIFLVTGGVAYTIGSILYGLGKKKKWMHSIFHLFIIAGSVLHFFAIVLYAL